MAAYMKSIPSFVLFAVLLLNFVDQGTAGMTCEAAFGVTFTCPVLFQDESKAFCCYDKHNIPYCCDFPDYFVNNTAIIAGVVGGSLVLLLLIILCCCCCCSCCLLYKCRQRGTTTVVYGGRV